jgi:hypothetical protein
MGGNAAKTKKDHTALDICADNEQIGLAPPNNVEDDPSGIAFLDGYTAEQSCQTVWSKQTFYCRPASLSRP